VSKRILFEFIAVVFDTITKFEAARPEIKFVIFILLIATFDNNETIFDLLFTLSFNKFETFD